MNVTYIANSHVPSRTANSIHVMKMCQAILQNGHSVSLLLPRIAHTQVSLDEHLWHHYGIKQTFPIDWLPVWTRLRFDFAVKAVYQARRSGADLVYTRFLPAAVVAARTGLPTVYEAHEPSPGRFSSFFYPLLLRSKYLKLFVFITQALHGLLLQTLGAQLKNTPTVIAPDGVDLERFQSLPVPSQAREQLGLPPKHFTVGYTGHLYPGRGIELILELAQRCPQIFFPIIGGNPEDVVRYQHKAQEMQLRNVNFIGFVTNRELPLYQAACNVLLMPYQTQVAAGAGHDIAGFLSPMKMFEYLATGRLIIASDLPVLCEVLNVNNSVLCAPRDVDAWQQAIFRAQMEPAWCTALGWQAQQDAKGYTWQGRVRHIFSHLPSHVSAQSGQEQLGRHSAVQK